MDPRRHVVNSWREGGKGGRTEETYDICRNVRTIICSVARDAACILHVLRVGTDMQKDNVLVISGDLADDSL